MEQPGNRFDVGEQWRNSGERYCCLYRIRPAKYTVDGVWGGRIGYFALLAA
jgi:hypothetical protein